MDLETPKAATSSPEGRPLKVSMPKAEWHWMQESLFRPGLST